MTRLTKRLEQHVLEQFRAGVSMELLAERWHVGLWQIEQVIRTALTHIGGTPSHGQAGGR